MNRHLSVLIFLIVSTILFSQEVPNITEIDSTDFDQSYNKSLLQLDKTSSVYTLTSDEIENLPLRTLNDIVALSPGVVLQDDNLYIRGGRDNEVAYYLNGMPTTSFITHKNMIYLSPEATEEIQVYRGSFDVSMGGASSGIVTRRIKQGTNEFSGGLSVQVDGPGLGETYLNTRSYGHRIYTGTFSGPIIRDKLKVFTSFEQNYQDDPIRWGGEAFEFLNIEDQWEYGSTTIDSFDIVWPGYHETNDYFTNFVGNITLDLFPLKNNVSIVYNKEKTYQNGQEYNPTGSILTILRDQGATIYPAVDDPNYAYSVTIPGRQGYRINNSLMLSDEISWEITPKNHLQLNFCYLKTKSEDYDEWFGNDWQKWYDGNDIKEYLGFDESVWSPHETRYYPKSYYSVSGFDFAVPGTAPDNTYTKQETSQLSLSGSFTSSIINNHSLTMGFDWRKSTIREINIYVPGMIYAMPTSEGPSTYGITTYGSWDNVPRDIKSRYVDGYGYDLNGNEIDERKVYGYGENVYYIDGPKQPTELGFYLQDKMTFGNMIINAGLRLDILDTDEETIVDPDSITTYDYSYYIRLEKWEKVDPYVYLQPRLGISTSISDNAILFANIGKYVQMPDLNSTWYTAYDYYTQIGAGGNFYLDPVGYGLEPIETTQIEMGFSNIFNDRHLLEVAGFYKKQEGLLTVERFSYTIGETDNLGVPIYYDYNCIVNGDESTIKGIEMQYTFNSMKRFSIYANYTFSIAEGTGSNATSFLASIDRGLDRNTKYYLLDYNQTHVGTAILDYRFADNDGGKILENSGINLITTFSSGHNYTPVEFPYPG